ncbi:MAG: ABC transporter permease [Gammaproteobacteria bacterium]
MFTQIVEITLMNLRNIPARLGASSVIVVGIAGVVAVLMAILAMAIGFRTALESTGQPDRAIVLRGGSNGELSSGVSAAAVAIVSSLPGVLAASAELYTIVDVPKRSSGTPANLVVRGVTSAALTLRPEVRITAGRTFESGRREVIIGRGAAAEFAGLDLGAEIAFRDSAWVIVGVFEAAGGASESEIWGDLPVAQTAFRRGGTVSSMRLQLDQPARAAALAETIANDPRLDLQLRAEPEYYAAQSARLSALITGFGYVVAGIMAIGAVFAALNTMYSAVSSRTVEIATLRALGFGGTPVVISVLIEAVLLALLGALLGAGIAWFAFAGTTISTLAGFTQLAFQFTMTPALFITAIVWALVIGMIGGLFPALRAARVPITVALRAQ